MKKNRCSICGFTVSKDILPADFQCPVCLQPASKFFVINEDLEKKLTIKPAPKADPIETGGKEYACPTCGFRYTGDTIPGDFTCPICLQPASKFVPAAPIKIFKPTKKAVKIQSKPCAPAKYVCKVCGAKYAGDTVPADYRCPICLQPASSYISVDAPAAAVPAAAAEPVVEAAPVAAEPAAEACACSCKEDSVSFNHFDEATFVCSICGYKHRAVGMHDGFKCPLCLSPASKFKKQ